MMTIEELADWRLGEMVKLQGERDDLKRQLQDAARKAGKIIVKLEKRVNSLKQAAKRKTPKPRVKRIRARRGYTRTVTQIGVTDAD